MILLFVGVFATVLFGMAAAALLVNRLGHRDRSSVESAKLPEGSPVANDDRSVSADSPEAGVAGDDSEPPDSGHDDRRPPASADADGTGAPSGDPVATSDDDSPDSADATTDTSPAPTSQRDPFEGVTAKGAVLELPKFRRKGALSAREMPHQEIAKLYVESLDECELSILGASIVFGGESKVDVTRKTSDDAGQAVWDVHLKRGASGNSRLLLAEFVLSADSLTFQWNADADVASCTRLRYCLLEIALDGNRKRCALSSAVEVEPIRFDLERPKQSIDLPMKTAESPRADQLIFDLKVRGVDGRLKDGAGIRASMKRDNDKKPTMTFVSPNEYPSPWNPLLLKAEVSVLAGELKNQIVVEYTTRLPKVDFSAQQRSQKGIRVTSRRDFVNWSNAKLAVAQKHLSGIENRISQAKERAFQDRNIEKAQSIVTRGTDHPLYERALDDLNAWKKEFGENYEKLKIGQRWCHELQELQDNIQEQGQLHYRAYITIEGQQIDLMRSPDF